MGIKALIVGCEGLALTKAERDFIRKHQPWGLILFARNIESRTQVKALCAEFRSLVGRDNAPILVDQEGGRVRRMRPPHWPEYCPGRTLGALYESDAQAGLRAGWLHARLMANDLAEVGINVDCLPVLDVPVPGAHDVIGDRAYGLDPTVVAAMGRAASEGLVDGGVLPIMKHIPGHGRSKVDSHDLLPVVESEADALMASDFAPFKALNDLPMAMTAHVIYSRLDADHPATTSATIIGDIIRGHIGFDGLLMSDDLSMQALSGDYAQRTQRAFEAGCDLVLHCNGKSVEMDPVADACGILQGKALTRAQAVEDRFKAPTQTDLGALREEYETLIGSRVA